MLISPEPLAEGLLRLALPTETLPPSDHTNAFVLGWHRALLLEPAPRDVRVRDALLDWIEAQRSRGLRIEALAVTHHHPDHTGAAAWLRERLGVPLWAHPATAERIDVEVDRFLDDESSISLRGPRAEPITARWLWTPGHAPGHLAVLVEPAHVVLAGDMVSTESTILVDPDDGGDMKHYLDSLRRLRALGADRIAPAHGPPAPATALLEHFLRHRLAREERIVRALRDTPRRETALLAEAYADTPQVLWPLARRSLRAHLLKLEAEGRAERTPDGWCSPPSGNT